MNVHHGPSAFPITELPISAPPQLTVHVVSHTHWDREWYQPAERFRQWLIPLVDELLDDPSSDGSSFLLDGQTVVLEDYLEVRPERASELAAALKDGRLEAGPWFVLPDELIPGGEGLVRNLLAGRRTMRSLRASAPSVLYCPDSFGHPAILPELAREFDCPVIILWRGLGGARSPKNDVLWWTAPSGERALVYHLAKSGYELGASLPTGTDIAKARWSAIREQLDARRTLDVVLLLNGADHHARQRNLASAIDTLRTVAEPDTIEQSTLAAFGLAVAQRASDASLPDIQGELRDSYGYAWTLQGTLATRAPQKRRYARAERELVRDSEPWVALANFHRGTTRRPLMNAAWRPLLLCQPHDTLCGCSVDRVARAAEDRLESATIQAHGLREDALLDWLGHDRDDARRRVSEWIPSLVVRNRAARVRSGVALVDLLMSLRDVPVGPGSAPQSFDEPVAMRTLRPAVPGPVQVMRSSLHNSRVEAPRAYPDNDSVVRSSAVVWVNEVPAYGLTGFALTEQSSVTGLPVPPVTVSETEMGNGTIRLSFTGDQVAFEQKGRRVEQWIAWDSRTDEGDLYTPSIRGTKIVPRLTGTRVLASGPLRGVIEQRWVFAKRDERVNVKLRFILDAGARFVRVHVAGTNEMSDHRLRIGFRTDVADANTVADAAFGPVRRRLPKVRPDLALTEEAVPTAPLHRYVSLFDEQNGATVFSDGLTEYESGPDSVAVTLLRCVGQLSRADLPERPGHAGWPSATPEAQCIGPFAAQLAFMLHGSREPAVVSDIERTSDDVLYPLTGHTLRSALRVPPPTHGIALEGEGLAFSAAKESEDGQWLVLRCVNLLPQLTSGAWHLGRPLREAHTARLDETPIAPVRTNDNTITFIAPPRGIVTILAR